MSKSAETKVPTRNPDMDKSMYPTRALFAQCGDQTLSCSDLKDESRQKPRKKSKKFGL